MTILFFSCHLRDYILLTFPSPFIISVYSDLFLTLSTFTFLFKSASLDLLPIICPLSITFPPNTLSPHVRSFFFHLTFSPQQSENIFLSQPLPHFSILHWSFLTPWGANHFLSLGTGVNRHSGSWEQRAAMSIHCPPLRPFFSSPLKQKHTEGCVLRVSITGAFCVVIGLYSISHDMNRKPAWLRTSLKCLYTNAHSMQNRY